MTRSGTISSEIYGQLNANLGRTLIYLDDFCDRRGNAEFYLYFGGVLGVEILGRLR